MALNKGALKLAYKQLMIDMREIEDNPDASMDEFATRFANMMDDYVKGATVTVQPGQTVTTTGSATAQSGVTTTNGTGSLS